MHAIEEFLLQFGIHWQVALAQAIGFLILFGIVKRFLFGPVGQIMQQREERIVNQLANAEAQQVRAESLRKEYEDHLTRIADEARERFDVAMKEAEAARQKTLQQTQEEVRALYQRHESQLERDREQLRRDLRGELSDLAVMAAAKALRGQMTPTIQSAVIDQVISELGQSQQA
ncbi:MAG: F0F1 ATP synthase subunit B [Armatimonadota bacterium]